MVRFFQNTTVPAQDVEMGIGNEERPSTHTTSPPPDQPPDQPQIASEIVMFIENQKKTIETCMVQVSHSLESHCNGDNLTKF